MSKLTTPKVAFALLAAALATMPAAAETITRHVHYADLNLTTPAGKASLERRVRTAVSAVCGSFVQAGGNLVEMRNIRTCRRKSHASARSQMNVAIARAEQRGNQRLADAR